MVIESASETKAEEILSKMKALGFDTTTAKAILDVVQGPEAERMRAFLQMRAGPNDERGFKKFCPSCNDFTGHFVLPGSAWYFERCFRCRKISAWRVLLPRLPPFGKAVIMPPGMDEKGILRLVLTVAGPEYVARCFEIWLKKKVAAKAVELSEELKLRAMEERLAYPTAAPSPEKAGFSRL